MCKNVMSYDSPLYVAVMTAYPEHRNAYQLLDIISMARAVGLSQATLYNALRYGVMSPKTAEAIVNHSKGRINSKWMDRFVHKRTRHSMYEAA